MSVKRQIESVDSPESPMPKKAVPIIIEPAVNLPGPDNFDQSSKKRVGHEQTSRTRSPSTTNQSFHDGEDQPDQLLPPILSMHIDTKELCFGMIHNANAAILEGSGINNDIINKKSLDFISSHFQLSFKDDAVFLGTPSSQEFAVLNKQIARLLQNLSALDSCRFKAYPASTMDKNLSQKPFKTGKDSQMLIDIVVYGSSMIRQSVDRIMCAGKIWLQAPDYQDVESVYDNPHELNLDALLANLGLEQPPIPVFPAPLSDPEDENTSSDEEEFNGKATKKTRLQLRVSKVLQSLTRPKSLKKLEADVSIKTKLLDHQKSALDFMEQREFGPIASEYSLWSYHERNGQVYYQHVITEKRVDSSPVETIGGILADDMGLGKTLIVLSTIIRTRESAKSFAESNKLSFKASPELSNSPHQLLSRATLVIAPSSLLIDGWKKEIEEHCAGSLSIHVYHGRSREVDSEALADWDIVITTYHTIIAESLHPENPIKRITWFRIVLDEAHIIRNMKTKLFQEVAKLSAKFRWCLTGTPVQNGLEDLVALIAFLRLYSLEALPEFKKYILMPLTKDTEDGIIGLRNLLDSICLRRTKRLLNLPETIIEDRHIDFSPEEREIYNKLIAVVKNQESEAKNSADYLRIFSLQLQLRRICNHGTYQKSLSESAIGNAQFDPEQAFDILRKKRKRKCTLCKVVVTNLSNLDKLGGRFTSCGHLLCLGCIPKFQGSLESFSTGIKCLICERILQEEYIITGEETYQGRDFESQTHLSNKFDNSAKSTKISALTHDIMMKRSEGKSIIFSCWTRSLDLVAHFLTGKKINFLRIDGTYSHLQRQKVLDDYCLNDNIQILLMTTGTGAVGLNLTVANRVYMLEPQWNPMIESQAIARVVRLGQQRNVKVLRYTINGTIEENLRAVQKRKLGLARIGWKESVN